MLLSPVFTVPASSSAWKDDRTSGPEATLSNPSAEAPTGVDPDYANNVLKTMRETVSKPNEVKKPIEIKVDAGT